LLGCLFREPWGGLPLEELSTQALIGLAQLYNRALAFISQMISSFSFMGNGIRSQAVRSAVYMIMIIV
jgi:hypothetical protein